MTESTRAQGAIAGNGGEDGAWFEVEHRNDRACRDRGSGGGLARARGPSLKKLVKKEVAKQIAKATGPAGPSGADGTARGYAHIGISGFDASASKGVISAVPSGDNWCFDLSFVPTVVVASKQFGSAGSVQSTGGPTGANSAGCPAPNTDALVDLDSGGVFFVLFN